jgi:hypothetical protein
MAADRRRQTAPELRLNQNRHGCGSGSGAGDPQCFDLDPYVGALKTARRY